MRCPECGCIDDKVLETRFSKDKDLVRRRRECLGCGVRFTTQEEVIRAELMVVKSSGSRQDFSAAKLRLGLSLACRKRPVSDEQIDEAVSAIRRELERRFERDVPARVVGELAMEKLRELDSVAFVRFASVYRDFRDAGEFVTAIRDLEKPS